LLVNSSTGRIDFFNDREVMIKEILEIFVKFEILFKGTVLYDFLAVEKLFF